MSDYTTLGVISLLALIGGVTCVLFHIVLQTPLNYGALFSLSLTGFMAGRLMRSMRD